MALLTGRNQNIGEILVSLGRIVPEALELAAKEKENSPLERMGEILLRLELTTEEDLHEALAIQYGVPFARLTRHLVDRSLNEILPAAFMRKHRVAPMFRVEGQLTVAMSDPTNMGLLDELARLTGCEVLPVVAVPSDIETTLEDILHTDTSAFEIDDIVESINESDVQIIEQQVDDLADLEHVAGLSPVVKLVNYVIYRAVNDGASDIHIEPEENASRIRQRIDGSLTEMMTPPPRMHPAIVSRIKVMADLDISERRNPQDGRFRVILDRRPIDVRVSTLPTIHGEKLVLRLLDRKSMRIDIRNVGIPTCLLELIHAPNGIVLVTGPTGSGKTTTLYGILQEINKPDFNICTVENPVEFGIQGVNQVQANEKGGLGFADALRSLLRQDPDVIMIGEIRDLETALIATQASLTGHLVLATLHTNDSISAVTRLINMGIDPYLIGAALRGVVSQRLVRRLCARCRKPGSVPAALRKRVELLAPNSQFFVPKGCEACRGSGFTGRIGLFELLRINDELADTISESPTLTELRRKAQETGLYTLLQDGVRKASEGITSLDEVMRVVAS
jgi:type IV pilus assembly protein PilB